jgi:hypothetical protein
MEKKHYEPPQVLGWTMNTRGPGGIALMAQEILVTAGTETMHIMIVLMATVLLFAARLAAHQPLNNPIDGFSPKNLKAD